MSEQKRLWHKRLNDWEHFDQVEFKVVPRYKTSGLSGDEWRQHVQVTFSFKGEAIHSCGFRDMKTALAFAYPDFARRNEAIHEKVLEMEEAGYCDQPSCKNKATSRLKIKSHFSARGEALDPSENACSDYYRQFCSVHVRRGDASREDCESNYEVISGPGPESSSNVQESPAATLVLNVEEFMKP